MLLAVVTAVVAVLILAAPAGAHAVLLQTSPASGQTYPSAPKVVQLLFDENVQVGLGGIRLLDSKSDRITTGKPTQTLGGKQVSVSVPALKDGTYVVTWRVISADGHPVQNAFTFSVGQATAVGSQANALANAALAKQAGSRPVGIINGALRFIEFVAAGILLGGFAFIALCWPNGRRSRSTLRLIRGAWLVAFLGSIATVLVEASYTAGLKLTDSVKPSIVHDYIDTHIGRVLVLRVVVLILLGIVGRVFLKRERNDPLQLGVAAIGGLALLATFTFAGHARSGFQIPLAELTDLAHVSTFTLWFGGLVVLLVAVLRPDDPSELEPAVSRFSTLALIAVTVLIGTGVYQGWRQVGSWGALKGTTYGRLLLVKLALVAVVVVVAAVSRDTVRNRFAPDDDDETPPEPDAVREPLPVGPGAALARLDVEERADTARRLRVSVAIEVVFLVAVLVTTALLVDAAPGRTAINAPYSQTIQAKGVNFEVLLVPARSGPNDLHITATKESGLLDNVLQLTLTLSNPAKNVAPITVTLIKLGPGHYTSNALAIPFSGTWILSIKALVSQIDEVDASATIHVRS
jgi:copper transport protein